MAEKKPTSLYIDRDNMKKLKLLAIEKETSVTALVDEAINNLLKRHGKD